MKPETQVQVSSALRRVNLPTLGIGAFSLCSVNSIYHLLSGNALHPNPILYAPAVLVELVTAWSVYKVVETGRQLSKSRISKQDKKFYAGILAAFVAVSVPLVGVSTWANTVEFGGNFVLGALFPVASIGCAVGAALPNVTARYVKGKETLAKAQADERKRKQEESARQLEESKKQALVKQEESERKQEESERKQEESRAQLEESKRQALVKQEESQRKLIENLGKAGATLEQYFVNPRATQESVAQELGITRQAVGQHLRKLENAGVIKRNGRGVEVLELC